MLGRLATVALVAGALAAIALTPEARAARGLTTGFGGHYYQSDDPGTRARWLDRTVDADAGLIKLNLQWNNIARFAFLHPGDAADPRSRAYDFSWVDASVRDATARGLGVSLLVGGTPNWAMAPGKPGSVNAMAWNPDPSDLADFMHAVATRYSGHFDPDGSGPAENLPEIAAVEIWNEPNASGSLSPQFDGRTDVAGPIYRRMLNASYGAVKAADPDILVVTGGTNPYGARPGGPYRPDLQLVPPVNFWQDVLCVHPKRKRGRRAKAKTKFVRTRHCPAPAKFDVLAHHPIDNTGGGPLAHGPLPGDVSTPDLGLITRILRGAERARTTLPGKHPVWVTEFWWDSRPPNNWGASLKTQARWIEQSLYLFWKAGASAAFNLTIGDASYLDHLRSGYQSGPYFQDGDPKPSLAAFQFPFVTSRLNRTTLQAWGKAPEAGKLLIQRQRGGWKTIRRLHVGSGSVFITRLKLSGRQRLRAKLASRATVARSGKPARRTSLVWKQR